MNLSIQAKIVAGFGLLVVMTLGMGWYALSKLEEEKDIMNRITSRDFRIMEMLQSIAISQGKTKVLRVRVINQYLLRQDKSAEDATNLAEEAPKLVQEQCRQAQEQTESLLKELDGSLSEFEKSAQSNSRKAQWVKIRQNVKETLGTMREIDTEGKLQFGLAAGGSWNQLIPRQEKLDNLRKDFDDKIETAAQLALEATELGKAEAGEAYESARFSTLVVLATVLMIGIAFSVLIQRSIASPLANFIQVVERVGQGDLTQKADTSSGDELARLGHSLNQMVAGLRELAAQARTATENLNAASAEILASTQQQATSTAEQSAAVQQTTTTMEEVGQAGSQISERAKQVATAAEATSSASKAGLAAVQDVNRIMESIREQAEAVAENIVALSEKTQAVGDIIATVNDIAEQTNLLALNAAIEAAAAGEQGRSFSVVANEMKNLADQAKDSTVQIRSILGDIQKGINTSVMLTEEAVKRVEAGKQQTDVADDTIRQMSGSIQESVQAFQQIVGATNQQQIGFEQVTQALKNIRQATEQTASGTRQLEKAAANLNALGQQLLKAVETYRT